MSARVFVSPPMGCAWTSPWVFTSPATRVPDTQPMHPWNITGYNCDLRFPKLGIVCGWELPKSLIRTWGLFLFPLVRLLCHLPRLPTLAGLYPPLFCPALGIGAGDAGVGGSLMGLAWRGWLHACSKAQTSVSPGVSPGFFPCHGSGLTPAYLRSW